MERRDTGRGRSGINEHFVHEMFIEMFKEKKSFFTKRNSQTLGKEIFSLKYLHIHKKKYILGMPRFYSKHFFSQISFH